MPKHSSNLLPTQEQQTCEDASDSSGDMLIEPINQFSDAKLNLPIVDQVSNTLGTLMCRLFGMSDCGSGVAVEYSMWRTGRPLNPKHSHAVKDYRT